MKEILDTLITWEVIGYLSGLVLALAVDLFCRWLGGDLYEKTRND